MAGKILPLAMIGGAIAALGYASVKSKKAEEAEDAALWPKAEEKPTEPPKEGQGLKDDIQRAATNPSPREAPKEEEAEERPRRPVPLRPVKKKEEAEEEEELEDGEEYEDEEYEEGEYEDEEYEDDDEYEEDDE